MEYRVWDHMVYEYGDSIGKRVKYNGDTYTFFGLVYGDDDLYYGLCSDGKGPLLLSAVGSMDSHGVDLIEGEWPKRLGWTEWIAAGGPKVPHNWCEREEAPSDEC